MLEMNKNGHVLYSKPIFHRLSIRNKSHRDKPCQHFYEFSEAIITLLWFLIVDESSEFLHLCDLNFALLSGYSLFIAYSDHLCLCCAYLILTLQSVSLCLQFVQRYDLHSTWLKSTSILKRTLGKFGVTLERNPLSCSK